MSEVRCDGFGCSKLLGKVEGTNLILQCPRCKKPRTVPILTLVEELTSYLETIKAQAEDAGKAGGFML